MTLETKLAELDEQARAEDSFLLKVYGSTIATVATVDRDVAQAMIGEILDGAVAPPRSQVRVRVYDADGRPTPTVDLSLHWLGRHDAPLGGVLVFDADYEPVMDGVAAIGDGSVTLSEPVTRPLVLSWFPIIPGYGSVRVFADCADLDDIDLPLESARSRIRNTQAVLDVTPASAFRGETLKRHAAARARLAVQDITPPDVYAALCDAMWAGEMATLDAARHTIKLRGARRDFLIGCGLGNVGQWGADEQYGALFNFATLNPFYLSSYEPKPGELPLVAEAERMLDWCEARGIAVKGHPLVWPSNIALPEWLRGKGYAALRDAHVERVRREMTHFKGRIGIWDIMNEAHIPSPPVYRHDDLVELTNIVGGVAHDTDPSATRVVNVNHPTGEYTIAPVFKMLTKHGYLTTPMHDLRSVDPASFDAVGIQMYYWGLDMLELKRLLDRLASLGKPVHVTEIGVASNMGIHPPPNMVDEQMVAGWGTWRRPWDEALQADWVEEFYTLCYATSYVDAMTWWDIMDGFYPWGGLLHRDGTPKPSYTRLLEFTQSWGKGR